MALFVNRKKQVVRSRVSVFTGFTLQTGGIFPFLENDRAVESNVNFHFQYVLRTYQVRTGITGWGVTCTD